MSPSVFALSSTVTVTSRSQRYPLDSRSPSGPLPLAVYFSMRRALQIGTISLTDIPIEIVEEIVQLTSITDQLALCITSKLLNTVALRFLYRCITLRSPVRIVQCCKTLKTNTSAAIATRNLYFIISQSSVLCFVPILLAMTFFLPKRGPSILAGLLQSDWRCFSIHC